MENGGKKMVMVMLKEVIMVVLVPVLRPVSVVGLWSAGGKVSRTLSILSTLSISASEKTDHCRLISIPYIFKTFLNFGKQLICQSKCIFVPPFSSSALLAESLSEKICLCRQPIDICRHVGETVGVAVDFSTIPYLSPQK